MCQFTLYNQNFCNNKKCAQTQCAPSASWDGFMLLRHLIRASAIASRFHRHRKFVRAPEGCHENWNDERKHRACTFRQPLTVKSGTSCNLRLPDTVRLFHQRWNKLDRNRQDHCDIVRRKPNEFQWAKHRLDRSGDRKRWRCQRQKIAGDDSQAGINREQTSKRPPAVEQAGGLFLGFLN